MKHQRSGFTLIELLVLIAIIAILAAILFPVFAQARSQARKTVCLSNMKEIMLATRMYMDDYDGCFPCIQASDGKGNWTVVSWWAVHFYQQALDPYIKMGRGTTNLLNVWWDPSDPSKNMPYMWGSFINNGLLTCNNTCETAIEKPSETIYSGLRAKNWDEVTGTAPLPVPASPSTDPFWTSEYFDFGIDPYDKTDPNSPYWWSHGNIFPPCSLFPSDPYCVDWEPTQTHTGMSIWELIHLLTGM